MAAQCQGALHLLLLVLLSGERHRAAAHCLALLHEWFVGAASERAAAKCRDAALEAQPQMGSMAGHRHPSLHIRAVLVELGLWGPACVAEQPYHQRVPTKGHGDAALFPNRPGACPGCGNPRSRVQPRVLALHTPHSPTWSQLTSLGPILILQSQWPGTGTECPWGWRQWHIGDSS